MPPAAKPDQLVDGDGDGGAVGITGIIMVMRGKLHYMPHCCIYTYMYAFAMHSIYAPLQMSWMRVWGAPQSCMHGMQFMAMLESFLSSLHLLINALAKSWLQNSRATGGCANQTFIWQISRSGGMQQLSQIAKCKVLSQFRESLELLTATSVLLATCSCQLAFAPPKTVSSPDSLKSLAILHYKILNCIYTYCFS